MYTFAERRSPRAREWHATNKRGRASENYEYLTPIHAPLYPCRTTQNKKSYNLRLGRDTAREQEL